MEARFIADGPRIGLTVEAETSDERILLMAFGRQSEGKDVTGGFVHACDEQPGRKSVSFWPKDDKTLTEKQ